jgi:hypothetical protein
MRAFRRAFGVSFAGIGVLVSTANSEVSLHDLAYPD